MPTMILNCTCKHETQDKIHGAGRRVHNRMARKPKSPIRWRCTICGKVQDHGTAPEQVSEAK